MRCLREKGCHPNQHGSDEIYATVQSILGIATVFRESVLVVASPDVKAWGQGPSLKVIFSFFFVARFLSFFICGRVLVARNLRASTQDESKR